MIGPGPQAAGVPTIGRKYIQRGRDLIFRVCRQWLSLYPALVLIYCAIKRPILEATRIRRTLLYLFITGPVL